MMGCFAMPMPLHSHSNSEDPFLKVEDAKFRSAAKSYKISHRSVINLKGIANGYYLIAGVFGEAQNASRLARTLKRKGLTANTLVNPRNQMHYVFVGHTKKGLEALDHYQKTIKPKYQNKIWILNVQNAIPAPLKVDKKQAPATTQSKTARISFSEMAKASKIATRSIESSPEIAPGYYLIGGVFGEAQNASRLARTLKKKGLTASTLVNPRNQMHYVFVGHTKKGLEALDHYQKTIKPKYQDKIWILNVVNASPEPVAFENDQTPETIQPKAARVSFSEMAKAGKIATRSIESSPEIASGYYLIGGVFGEAANAKRFSSKLKARYSTAGRLQHPETGLYHVYLDRLQEGEAAIATCNSHYEGRYTDKLWILEVVPPPAVEMEEGSRISGVLSEEALPLESRYIRKQTFSLPLNDKLLQKADQYFDKMWYAEAAEIYETVLAKAGTNPDYRIIQRAADSHYFNTNMERAFYWYDLLYRNHRKEMSADNLFKYAHALKGTGKYARSKRLMRLYERKMRNGEGRDLEDMNKPIPNEVLLDNIRNTSGEYEVKNIGVNSPYSDFAPMFHGEDQLVFASAADSAFFKTRRYKWNNQPYLDL